MLIDTFQLGVERDRKKYRKMNPYRKPSVPASAYELVLDLKKQDVKKCFVGLGETIYGDNLTADKARVALSTVCRKLKLSYKTWMISGDLVLELRDDKTT